ncbi:MAG: hypothetical protein DI565_13865 [Ancylobacter novellus]|uniref:Uncharacterized protein n=1 Tax=Ancylobacter novellus TaxID=921 RepID=A0A2W5KD62_ANCNO|nr:MAG: hypothetical protein DI565_13865 [Ancylobacter novellus]
MPYRVSSGPAEGRTIIVAHSAQEALSLYRMLQEQGAENLDIGHLERGPLTINEVSAIAATEADPSPETPAPTS